MPRSAPPVYQRGKYWLDWDETADGDRRSPYLTIFWYDAEARRIRSASTRSADEGKAIAALDRRYLADAGEAPAFCHACGQPLAQAESYLLIDAIQDYKLEWGDHQLSATSIDARLNHVIDFLEAQDAAEGEGSFGTSTSCAAACTSAFIESFRRWSRAQPVVWRNGDGEITVERARAPSTTEESVTQLIAALNHAVDAEPSRSDKRPTYRPIPRKLVSRPRRSRADVETLARMVRYASQPKSRRETLHAFLVASICTIARPDAVVDISVNADRHQWWPGSPTLDLNPAGRLQTKKFRPVIPVVPVLQAWLEAEFERWRALPAAERRTTGWLVNARGLAVSGVKTSWRSMLDELKLPTGREWQPYLIRHSMATLVRNRGATKWDLDGFMGHDVRGQTEIYAIGEFRSVERALIEILGEIDQLAPGCLHRNDTGAGLPARLGGRLKMPG